MSILAKKEEKPEKSKWYYFKKKEPKKKGIICKVEKSKDKISVTSNANKVKLSKSEKVYVKAFLGSLIKSLDGGQDGE